MEGVDRDENRNADQRGRLSGAERGHEGVVKTLSTNVKDLEVYGFLDGYKGLIYENYRKLTSKDFSGILTVGGTILGSSRQPFKLMRVPDENGLDKVEP